MADRDVGQAEPRALPADRAPRVGAGGPARPATLAPRAPGGGDALPRICRRANFQLPELGEERERCRARKLLHLVSFTLSWAGEGWEETRPPWGQARRAGGRKGGGRFPPRGWCQSSPQRSLDPPTRRPDRAPDRRTRAGAGGRPSAWGGWQGRASRLDAPGLRGRRARPAPAESRTRQARWEGAEGAPPASAARGPGRR